MDNLKRGEIRESMLKLCGPFQNHHLSGVKMLAKYIRRGSSEIDNLIWSFFAYGDGIY
jgi:vacuolar-type H+-ATPase subunit C/Vma6